VIRNQAVPSSQVSIREGHNDRRSQTPLNADIVVERYEMNVCLHENFTPDGTKETYQQTLNRLLAEEKIVKHNFKPKSAIVDEFILDVNSEYFEENGGYDFAVCFYEEAYKYAIEEAGSEDYIVSAVLHADERHKELSERYGRDIFHYHLHVVYVPVVHKEIKWTKRAGPELAGKVKKIIPQINHTEKWPRKKLGGKFINEYSKLQDRFHNHMVNAGYKNLERGERGSTAEHLTVEEYKYQQEKKRVAEVSAQVEKSEIKLDELSKITEKKEKRISKLDEQLTIKEKAKATISEIEVMGKPVLIGNGYSVTGDELKKLKSLAKKGVSIDKRADEYKKKIETLNTTINDLNSNISSLQRDIKSVIKDRETWKKNYERSLVGS
jgi:chaperonin cofactor prefoldin